MNKYLSRLTSTERRFLAAVVVVVFLVLNLLFVWPRFADWHKTKIRLADAQKTLAMFQAECEKTNSIQEKVKTMESEGESVPPEDQAIEFMRAIQAQAQQSGVGIVGSARTVGKTNQFFMEQAQTVTVQSGERQLVDFLYNLSSRSAMIRVRDLSIRPDPPHLQLAANIKFVASYQKKPLVRPTARPVPAPAARSGDYATNAKPAKPTPTTKAAPTPAKSAPSTNAAAPGKSATSGKTPTTTNAVAPSKSSAAPAKSATPTTKRP